MTLSLSDYRSDVGVAKWIEALGVMVAGGGRQLIIPRAASVLRIVP